MGTVVEEVRVEGTPKARWTRLAALGLLLAGIAPVLMLLAGILWGFSEFPTFFLMPAGLGLVGSYLVVRFGTWSKIVGIVLGVAIAMMLFWTAFGLFTPNSFFDFVPGVMVIPGVLIALVAGIGAIVAGRRGNVTPAATGGERTAIRTVLAVVVGLAVVSGVLTFAARTTVTAGQADTTVSLKDFEFDQASYELAAGSTVLVRNDDPFLHTFTIEELDIDLALSPGSEKLVEMPSQTGEFVLFCRPHTFEPEDPSPDDMAATVIIR